MDASGNVQGLKAALQNVGTVRVADYQRDYSWGPEEIDALWSDVELLLSAESQDEHFLGTLIFQRVGTNSNSFELVDGQQRLTTLFLFMVALLDQSRFHESTSLKIQGRTFNVAQEIENFILGEPDATSPSKSARAKLIPLAFLQKIFDKITDIELSREKRLEVVPKTAKKGDPSASITLPLRRAYNHVDKKINENLADFKRGSDAHLEQVYKVLRVFMEKLKVLTIHTDDLEDSLDVFMTLNNRGTPLGVFDLFRGEILKARLETCQASARDELFQQSLEEWKSIMENLGSYSADKYIRHFALVVNKEKVKDGSGEPHEKPKPLTMKKLPRWTTEYISSSANPSYAAEKLWEDVVAASDDYGYFLNPKGNNFTDYYLEAMRLIGESYRVLLLGINLRDENIWPDAKRRKLLKICYKLMVKWQLSGGNAQELEGKFQALAQKFRRDGDVLDLCTALEKEASLKFDLEARLIQEAPIDDAMAKSLLLLLEGNFTEHSVKIDFKEVQLEHIAPQKKTSHWHELIGEDYGATISRLGNLVLLDSKINSKIQQSPFKEKCKKYEESRLVTVRDLLSLNIWDLDAISSRQQWLARQLSDMVEMKQPLVLYKDFR